MHSEESHAAGLHRWRPPDSLTRARRENRGRAPWEARAMVLNNTAEHLCGDAQQRPLLSQLAAPPSAPQPGEFYTQLADIRVSAPLNIPLGPQRWKHVLIQSEEEIPKAKAE